MAIGGGGSVVSTHTAEKLVRWYNSLGCKCALSNKVSRALSYMGPSPVDAATIRSRPTIESNEDEQVPERVHRVIQRVLLERSLASASTAASVFDMSGRLAFCSCNDTHGNYPVSVMSAMRDNSNMAGDNAIRVVCPSCVSYREKSGVTISPLVDVMIKESQKQKVDQKDREKRDIYSVLMNASGGCGRDGRGRMSTFSGSWTCLLFNAEARRIDAEFLVSNRVSTSVRLQPHCICSELMYAISSIKNKKTNRNKFAFTVDTIRVFGGGEFLYVRYPVFNQGGPFDKSSPNDILKIINDKPLSHTGEEGAEEEEEEEKNQQPPIKRRRQQHQGASSPLSIGGGGKDDNVINMQLLLSTMLRTKRLRENKRHRSSSKSTGSPPQPPTDRMVVVESARGDDDEDNETRANPEIDNFLVPSPQVEEQCITTFQRVSTPIEKTRIEFAQDVAFLVDTRRIPGNGDILFPASNTLFSPPIITRLSFNRFRVVSGVLKFFDRVQQEEENGANGNDCVLDDNAALFATFKMLLCIRENSLARITGYRPNDNINIINKTTTTSLGVPISNQEIKKRKLCTATVLSLLAGLAKPSQPEDMD